MNGKKLLAGLMVTGVLTSALAVPVAGLAAPDEATSVSVEPDAAGIPVVISAEPDSHPVEISAEPDSHPVEISAEPDSQPADGATSSATAVPISDEVPVLTDVTLADLTKVAEYLAGKTELTPEEIEMFDLTGNGEVTLTDLTRLAAIYAEEEEDPSFGLPEADPAYATTRLMAEVTAVDTEENIVTVKEISPDAVDEIEALISEETIIINCESGAKETLADLKEGDKLEVYISTAMMPSLPPKAACYAIITNLPEEIGFADYVRVSSVSRPEATGDVVVLNQNADLYVTIPKDLEIEVFGEDTTASPDAIQDGTRLIVWYEIVLESYPAQTTALRCMIVPEPSESPEPEPSASEEPSASDSAEPSESVEPSVSAEPSDDAQPSDSDSPTESTEPSDGVVATASPTPDPSEA